VGAAVIIIVAGVSGSGKTTVAALLSGRLGWPFTDGDLLHPASNIAKMASGIPLTDQDRQPWLARIAAWMDERVSAGESAIVACSALKRGYRETLLHGRPQARIAMLMIDYEDAAAHIAARHGHFFDPRLLGSQFAELEAPAAEESSVIAVPVLGTAQATALQILRLLHLPEENRQAGGEHV
jgi:gluconokinase